jgi:hypothetical protein
LIALELGASAEADFRSPSRAEPAGGDRRLIFIDTAGERRFVIVLILGPLICLEALATMSES